MPADYRMGLVLFVLLELGIYWAMAKSDAPWFHNEAFAPWRNAFLAATAVLWLGIVSLWVAGRRSRRFGWLILLSIVWLLVLAGRIVPAFLIAASALPAFLTIFIGQLGCALMIPAALRERRKAVA
ncbi:MAG: hypothetical protein JXQ73_13275 [Phycisphaerae bacterium]|nr:hypothetical protein [Phycisphaerae bacterium]